MSFKWFSESSDLCLVEECLHHEPEGDLHHFQETGFELFFFFSPSSLSKLSSACTAISGLSLAD